MTPSGPRSVLETGAARGLRASAVAALTLLVATGSHTLAGGAMPPAAALAGMLVLAVGPCWVWSAHRWSVRELVAVFLLAQVGVHAAAMAAVPEVSGGSSGSMALTHLGGALLLVLLVRRGEAALWSLVDHLALRPARLLIRGHAAWHTPAVPILGPLLAAGGAVRPHDSAGRAPPFGLA